MSIEFSRVEANGFLTFSPDPPPHVKIEAYLIDIGGGANKGINYKKKVLEKAGWKYKALTSYGAHADTATIAFNNVREVLTKTEDKEEILDVLAQLKAS